MDRPTSITTIGVLNIVRGGLQAFLGILVIAASTTWLAPLYYSGFPIFFMNYSILIGLFIIIGGALFLIPGIYMLQRGNNWARIMLVVLCGLGIISNLAPFFFLWGFFWLHPFLTLLFFEILFELAVNICTIIWLFTGVANQWFLVPSEPPPPIRIDYPDIKPPPPIPTTFSDGTVSFNQAPSSTKAWLLTRQSSDQGRGFPLTEQEIIIGRGGYARYRINDPFSSKHHAKIRWENGAFVLYDLGSMNGTFVNDTKVLQRHVLYNNDKIRIGNTTVFFSFPPYDRIREVR